MISILENWCVVNKNPLHYLQPDYMNGRRFLHGDVKNHHMHPDGSTITSSYLIGKKGSLVVTVTGSEYRLGSICKEFGDQCPQAIERLLNSLVDLQ